MSTITINPAAGPARPRPGTAAARLVSAEFLKVRKRRGLAALTALLTVGAVVFTGGVMAGLHATNPAQYGPARGLGHLTNAPYIPSALGAGPARPVRWALGAGDADGGGVPGPRAHGAVPPGLVHRADPRRPGAAVAAGGGLLGRRVHGVGAAGRLLPSAWRYGDGRRRAMGAAGDGRLLLDGPGACLAGWLAVGHRGD